MLHEIGNFLVDLIELIGISGFIALFSGVSMGWYLAAINNYVPVASIKRSAITNFVASVSFVLPIAMERLLTDHPSLTPLQWFAMWALLVTFTMSADISNWVICHRAKRAVDKP